MLWEQEVQCVVMTTNLIEGPKTKCERYWPDKGSTTFQYAPVTYLLPFRPFLRNGANTRLCVLDRHYAPPGRHSGDQVHRVKENKMKMKKTLKLFL